MKFLHTSDWHVGKTLKGRSRLDEQEAVLTEIVGFAEQHQVDAVLIAGDLYDAAAPSADAQRILIKTLLALAGTGAQVIAMAGNHDSPGMLDAYRPLAGYAGITLLGQPRAADRGGVVTFTARKEAAGPGSLLFTMIDELNKYAPREGASPIKDVLLDIAERGRSLGIILIGAQQTASEVERRIIANSSVRVVGRLDAAEASRPEYGFLPAGQRQRATIAKPGTMFISQPEIPVPLAVDFPFPAWATREGEADLAGSPAGGAAASNGVAAAPGRMLSRVPFATDDPPPF